MNGRHRETRRRARTLLVILSVSLAGLAYQLGNLQLRQGTALTATARRQYTRVLSIRSPRGGILDRNGIPLATNRLAASVEVGYEAFGNTAVLRQLSAALGISYDVLRQATKQRQGSGRFFEPVLVKDDITPAEHTWISEHQDALPGVIVRHEPVREYPLGSLASHVLGYVGSADAGDVARGEAKPQDLIGKTGLETYYDEALRGQDGQETMAVDAGGRPVGSPEAVEPEPGDTLVLSLDTRIQRDTERALDYQMTQIRHRVDNDGRTYSHANRGAAVMIDVRTGEILALASLPGYDPNVFVRGDGTAIAALQADGLGPMWNRAIAGEYQPGSTFKLVTTVAAFTEGVDDTHRKIYCSGSYEIGNKRCWNWRSGPCGWVDVYKAIWESCDIYYYQLGRELGIDRLVGYMQDMGLGATAGIDLPGEAAGVVPTEAWRATRAADARNPQAWQLGDTLSAAIGQIETATPLQLAQYVAWVANGGEKVRPHLAREIRGTDGHVKRVFAPAAAGRVRASAGTLATLRRAMQLSPYSEGTAADGWWERFPIKVAAKTGTAENPPRDDDGTWVGFAPADNPQVAIAIVVEEAGHGGNLTPVARAMFASYFRLDLPPGDPARVPSNWAVGSDRSHGPANTTNAG